jgi:putative phosphoesterase
VKRTIGVISDTHGLVRPEVHKAFRRVDLILHAGDIGSPDVLKELQGMAPVTAVRGNNDKGGWVRSIPEREQLRILASRIYMIHDVKELTSLREVTGFDVVVSGHSHRPSIETRDGILFLNPGSAGPRRFSLPVTVAKLVVQGAAVDAEIVELWRP